jgi:hypothetical protein
MVHLPMAYMAPGHFLNPMHMEHFLNNLNNRLVDLPMVHMAPEHILNLMHNMAPEHLLFLPRVDILNITDTLILNTTTRICILPITSSLVRFHPLLIRIRIDRIQGRRILDRVRVRLELICLCITCLMI